MDNEKIFTAIKEGNLKLVKKLITYRYVPIEFIYLGCTDVGSCDADILRLLLDKGAEVDPYGFVRNTPIITVVRDDHMELVQMILGSFAYVYMNYLWESPSLMDAITLGDTEMVKLFMDENKGDFPSSCLRYSVALDYACQRNELEIIKLLTSRRVALCFPGDEDRLDPEFLHFDGEALCVAMQRGYTNLVEHYLEQGWDVNDAGTLETRATPLQFACERENKHMFHLFLKYGADVNANTWKQAPLHIAIEKGNAEFVEVLLSRGADVDIPNDFGRTPLYMAVAGAHARIVREILRYNPNIHNASNRASLKAAVRCDDKKDRDEIIKHLILYGSSAWTENMDEHVLRRAITKGYLHFSDCPVKGTEANSTFVDGYTLLHIACEQGDIQTIEYLLREGADINARCFNGLTPLHIAARACDRNTVELLLKSGANLNDQDQEGKTALYYAVQGKHFTTVMYLLECRPLINVESAKNPLCAAVMWDANNKRQRSEKNKVMDALLRYGFSVTPKDARDHRFLFYAIINENINIVRELLKYMTEEDHFNYRWEQQSTPLHHASEFRRKSIVKLLVKNGADVNARNFEGLTPMCSLIEGVTYNIRGKLSDTDMKKESRDIEPKCLEIVKILLKHGADPNIRDSKRRTAIFHVAACPLEMAKIAKLLLMNDADPKVVDKDNYSPFFMANREECYTLHVNGIRLCSLFLSYGAVDLGLNIDRETLSETYMYLIFPYDLRENYFTVDIDAIDPCDGTTPIQYAYLHDYYSADCDVRNLLECGADLNEGCNSWWHSETIKERMSLGAVERDMTNEGTYVTSIYEKARIVNTYILKLKLAGLKVPVDPVPLLSPKMRIEFENGCREELEKMKTSKIANTKISLRHILTDNKDRLAGYTKNKNVTHLTIDLSWSKDYPLYEFVIKGFVSRGERRKSFLERGEEAFRNICNGLPYLPVVCVRKILGYLTNQDLDRLIRNQKYR